MAQRHGGDQGQAVHTFTLGNKELEGKTAEFLYDRGAYSIIDIVGEERSVIYKSRNAQEAYTKWNVYIGRKKERAERSNSDEHDQKSDNRKEHGKAEYSKPEHHNDERVKGEHSNRKPNNSKGYSHGNEHPKKEESKTDKHSNGGYQQGFTAQEGKEERSKSQYHKNRNRNRNRNRNKDNRTQAQE